MSDLRLMLRLAAATRWLFLANSAFIILNAYLLPLLPARPSDRAAARARR